MNKIIFVSVMLLLLSLNVLAANTVTVSSPDVFANQGDTVTIPINFSGNKGLMGARLSFVFPDEVLELKDISSGTITENGLFNTTVTDYYSVKDCFDVVWSSSENFCEDGSFVILTFKVNEYAQNGEYVLNVTYSQSDTFDEEWNDVKLDCHAVKITVSDGTFYVTPTETDAESIADDVSAETEVKHDETDETSGAAGEAPDETQQTVSDDYMISSVELIADSFGLTDIDKATEAQAKTVLEFVNNRLKYYDENLQGFKSFAELRKAYDKSVSDKASADITATVDEETVTAIGNEVKAAYSVNSFADIPAEKQAQAVSEFIKKLNEAGADTVVFQKIDNPIKAAGVADNVLAAADEQLNNSKYITQAEERGNSAPIIAVICAVVSVVLIAVIIILKRKNRGKNK